MKERKRILYIGNKLAAQGATPTSIDILGPLLEAEGFHLRYASGQGNPVLRLFHMLLAIMSCRKYDCALIDTYSTLAFNYAWLTARVASVLKLKYISVLHGGDMPRRFARSPRRCRQIFQNSLANVVVSSYLEQHLKSNKYSTALIPNSIDLQQYNYKQRSEVKPNLLWVRSFHRIYNPEMAIRLVAALSDVYLDVKLTMVGPDKDGSLLQCQKLAAELGVEQRVVFTGKLTKEAWVNLSAQHDIFINTTRFDNMPVSLIEAMAVGLPVLSTNVGGIPFLIRDRENGLMVRDNNVGDMCMAIKTMMDDPELVENITKTAREGVEQFSWTRVKHQWFDILDKA